MKRLGSFVVFIALVAAVALTAGQFMPGAWYQALAKPSWTPPGWLFGPVWGVLYVMIAIAGWLVWKREPGEMVREDVVAARWFWVSQLVFNGLWSPVMFGAHQIGLAFAVLILMWISIVGFIVKAWPARTAAAVLFLPYLAWVSFAGALNFAIWRLNS